MGWREIYYFRDQQGLEVDFLVPGKSGAITLIEAKAGHTPKPAMAAPMLGLAKALKEKRPPKVKVSCRLIYRPAHGAIQTPALAPGVEAVAAPDFFRDPIS